ncbi:MAG TPA: hypothetical protein VJP88_06415, partial [Caulobacteraceae bacterium]|nr:hypothetical protein [Caulobacteraceae bacterium]
MSIRPETMTGAPFAEASAFVRKTTREGVRLAMLALGWILIAASLVVHPGLLLTAVGAVLVLRNSYKARR